MTLEEVQIALSDNPLFSAMMANDTLNVLLTELTEALPANTTPVAAVHPVIASSSTTASTPGNAATNGGDK